MRRIDMRRLALWLCVCLGLLPCGCGGETPAPDTDWTALQMAAAVAGGQADLASAHWLRPDDDAFAEYLSSIYGIDPETVEDGAVAYAGGTAAGEVAVLVLEDASAAEKAEQALLTYIGAREGDFTGYVPDQAAIAAAARTAVQGRYAALLICADSKQALETFLTCFDGTPPPADLPLPTDDPPTDPLEEEPAPETPEDRPPQDPPAGDSPQELPGDDPAVEVPPQDPPEDDPAPEMPEDRQDDYDPAAILAAWRGGDASGLSAKNRAILDGCAQVIDEIITDGMSDYDKELAVNDWMVNWAEYDPGALDQMDNPTPDNDNPYGFLQSRVGICLGYTRTFQLFMDMLDIECVTVEGYAHDGTEDHAWNMVRLDGDWYCVDVTWNDPVYSFTPTDDTRWYNAHYYFNVTSQFLRDNDHQWDETAVEEATATAHAWNPW